MKLEQLECRHMITHIIDQFTLDPMSKQDKLKVTNLKNLPKLQILKFWRNSISNKPPEVA